jgi:S1-C subfamily serine protease
MLVASHQLRPTRSGATKDGSRGQPIGFHRERGADSTACQCGNHAQPRARCGRRCPCGRAAARRRRDHRHAEPRRSGEAYCAVCGQHRKGRVAAEPGTKRRQAGKGVGSVLRARDEIRTFGSGVVFDALRGFIITNSHVIDHADEITVKHTDGRELPARRVGADPETDVAIIQVRADGLTELPFGNSDRLEVGDFVFAIGNPRAIGQTVTAGIVSGLHRTNVGLGPYKDFIQTDAAHYPGHSGGALVDLRGNLVGINTAFIAVGKNNPGMGLAIPINMASALVDQMLEFGDIRRGALGFTYDDFTAARSRHHAGAIVRAVDPRSAAERAGLKPGDLVTKLGGTPVRDAAELQIRLALLRIGEVAEFAVLRLGGTLTVRAEMAEREPAARSR